MAKITGRIIRILDKRTVIINLGSLDGVTTSSVFSIMGEPEPVIDPQTNEELGKVTVVKARVKAVEVAERFTIATSRWTETRVKLLDTVFNLQLVMGYESETEVIDEGELNVKTSEIEPWKAKSVIPVKIGDKVEVSIRDKDEENSSKENGNKPEDENNGEE